MRIWPITALSGLFLLAAVPQAVAGPEFEGPGGSAFQYYGHLNGAFVSVDDGVDTKSFFANNDNSTSRFGFNLRFRQPNDFQTRFRFETNLGLPGTSRFSNNPAVPDPTFNWTQTNLRRVEIELESDTWGILAAGQGGTASDGAAEVDQSGTGLTTHVAISDLAGGFEFRNAANQALSGIDIGSAFSQLDGNGRRCRIRYDTRDFSGFTFAASWGRECLKHDVDETYADISVTYINKFNNGTELQAKVAYFEQDISGTKSDGVTGSASVLFGSGLNFTFATGTKGTPSYVYGKIGYKTKLEGIGTLAIGIDYYDGNDFALTGGATQSESTSWGIGLTQTFDDYMVDGYLGYRNHSFDDDVNSYEDIAAFIFGARWRF